MAPSSSTARRGTAAAASPTMMPALSDTIWAVVPLASPRSLQALSATSSAVSSIMAPAQKHAAHLGSLVRELSALPFSYNFRLPVLGSEALAELLPILRPLRLLRRRELVGIGAGFVPTEADAWSFQSGAELQRFVAAVRAARAGIKRGLQPALLLGATLRLGSEQTASGPLATTSVGVEWAEGPAADPLQLGLRLVLGPGDRAEVDLELGSGGWSPWAETWSLRDGTLGARIAVAAPLPGGDQALLRQEPSDPQADAEGEQRPCEAEGVEVLRNALVEAGEAGVRAIICISGLCWRKEAPVWCPPEVQRVAVACAA